LSRLWRTEFYSRLLELYPQRINPYTAWLSATRLLKDQ
jgi:hypothetical protein